MHAWTVSELGDFLKTKRAAIAPESVGLPAVGNPRRVRGLRREEVALLAAMSVDHYTRMEQGRVTTASDSVLSGIATALRLSDDERTYLWMLAKPRTRGPVLPEPDGIDPGTRDLLDAMVHIPALVIDGRADVLAWNDLASALFLDFSAIPRRERNLVRMMFLDPQVRRLFPGWEDVAAGAVARLRMDVGALPGDRRLAEVVTELLTLDADFRRWWGGYGVRETSTCRKVFDHPVVGRMELDWQAMRLTAAMDRTLITYTAPAGSPAADALRMLASWAAG